MPLPSLNHDQWKPASSCTNDCTKIPKWSKMIQNVQWCAVMEWSKLLLILLPEVWQNPAWSRMRGSRLFLEFGQPLVHLLHLQGCRRYLWRIRCRCTLGDWLFEWLRVLWALLGQSLQLFSKCCNVLPRACWLRHFLHARCHLWSGYSAETHPNKMNLQSNNLVGGSFVDSASCAAKVMLIYIDISFLKSWL